VKRKGIDAEAVARLAGVSRSTVSRVVNNYSNVPPATRDKVMAVIKQYNYVPNASAQVLAGKRTRTIGLFMIDAGHVTGDLLSNLLLAAVIEHASELGHYVLTRIIRDAQDEEAIRGVRDMFYQRRIDGGIFIGAANREPFIEDLLDEGCLIGVVDRELSEIRAGCIVANFDNEDGMRQAVEHLHQMGHRKIGIVKGDMNRYSGQTKFAGFQAAMREFRLELRSEWILPGSFSEESGYLALNKLLDSGSELPTAMIMANDSVAFGAIRALESRGLNVPRDMSLIGFDDHPLSARFQPSLTTLKVDFNRMMEQLTALMIRQIEEQERSFASFSIRNELLRRNSCRAI